MTERGKANERRHHWKMPVSQLYEHNSDTFIKGKACQRPKLVHLMILSEIE